MICSTSLIMLFGSFRSNFSFAPSTKSLKSSRDSEGTTPGGRGVEGLELEVAAIADIKGGGAGFELARAHLTCTCMRNIMHWGWGALGGCP